MTSYHLLVVTKRRFHDHVYVFMAAMAGDVNMFLNDPDGERTVAEIEIMVAEKTCRRKGLGKEALCVMMHYGEPR